MCRFLSKIEKQEPQLSFYLELTFLCHDENIKKLDEFGLKEGIYEVKDATLRYIGPKKGNEGYTPRETAITNNFLVKDSKNRISIYLVRSSLTPDDIYHECVIEKEDGSLKLVLQK